MCDQLTIPSSDITLVQAVTDVVESIALEEVGLANILGAEACKIHKAIELTDSIDDLIKVNTSVAGTLENVIKNQMLLEFKLKEITSLFDKITIPLV